ncbi:RING finger protein 150-like [Antedon mediterranea]|uniref:RING finger protein 150-like n=1 Tax=Antedon mediterranea TaxID=105859 RepID=UPI003AF46DDD
MICIRSKMVRSVQNVVMILLCVLWPPQPKRPSTTRSRPSSSRPSRVGIVSGKIPLLLTEQMRRSGLSWALILLILLGFAFPSVSCTYDSYASNRNNEKNVNVTYIEEVQKVNKTHIIQSAKYLIPPNLPKHVFGILIQPSEKKGCKNEDYYKNGKLKLPPNNEQWIALVTDEKCPNSQNSNNIKNFEIKSAVAQALNASALLVYGSQSFHNNRQTQSINLQIPVIQLSKSEGEDISKKISGDDKRIWVDLQPSLNSKVATPIRKSSVLFVSISFIVLMVISLAWLVFYYVQRFRFAQARDRTQKRLGRAARKAIAKLPSKSVKECDLDFDYENCPVCLESYRTNDNLRILPCKHYFHKHCVDQWLIEHRTCPMCKLNILKALGYQPASRPSEDTFAIEIAEQAVMPMSDSSGILVVHLESIQFNPIYSRRLSSSSCSHLMGQGDSSTNSSSQDRSQDEQGFQEVMAVAEMHHDVEPMVEGGVVLPPGSSLV